MAAETEALNGTVVAASKEALGGRRAAGSGEQKARNLLQKETKNAKGPWTLDLRPGTGESGGRRTEDRGRGKRKTGASVFED